MPGAGDNRDRPTGEHARAPGLSETEAVRPKSTNDETNSLEEILGLGSDFLRAQLIGAGIDASEFEALEHVFASAQSAIVDQVAASGALSDPEQSAPARSHKPIEQGEFPVEMLAHLLAERGSHDDFSLADDNVLSPATEHISILIQMLPIAPNFDVASAIVQRLHRMGPHEKRNGLAVCRQGITELGESLPFESFDFVLPVLCEILSLEGSHTPLCDVLPQMVHACSGRAREALWPHVVDETLRHPRSEAQLVGTGILEFIDDLQPHAMTRAVQRLCQLPALSQGQLAANFFDPRHLRTYRMFASLLTSTKADLVGPTIIAVLRTHPVQLAGAEGAQGALLGMDRYRPEHAVFLHHLLTDMLSEHASEPLVRNTCSLLMTAIRKLDPEQRKAAWVPDALTYLGEYGSDVAKLTLEMVLHRKRLGLVPLWPSPCRKAAAEALELFARAEQLHE